MYPGPPGKTKKRADWLTGQIQRFHKHIERLDRRYEAGILDRDDWADLARDTEKTIEEYERERDEILAYLATQPPRPWWQFWGDAQYAEMGRSVMERERKRFSPGQLSPGQRVFHDRYGDGTVLEVKDRNGDQEITVQFKHHGTKRMEGSLTNLGRAKHASGSFLSLEDDRNSVFEVRSAQQPTSVTPRVAPQSKARSAPQSTPEDNIADDVCKILQYALHKLHPDDHETVYEETLGEVTKADLIDHDQYQLVNAAILLNSGVVNYVHNRLQNGDSMITAVEALRNAFQDLAIEVTKLRKHLYLDYLATQHWAELRKRAFERAKYSCELCFSKQMLEVHHKTYERLWQEDPNDLILLCRDCHAKFHDRLGK